MTEMAFETIEKCRDAFKLDFSSLELARLAQEKGCSDETLVAVAEIFDLLRERNANAAIQNLLVTSRSPLKAPKTFENLDFSLLKGKAIDRLKSLPSLAAIYSHKNPAFIGPAGAGKTHLAQAFGYACCQRGLKTFFIKMSELRDKFNSARKGGREASAIAGLVRPACLIIDEVGHCEFDKENTRPFPDGAQVQQGWLLQRRIYQ